MMSSEPAIAPTHRRQGVVMAFADAEGRWLHVRRSAQVERAPLKIGLPGGEIEPGETQQQAIVREAREELRIEAQPVELAATMDLPDRPWRLYIWWCRYSGDLRPDPSEVADVMWMTRREASEHPDALPLLGKMLEHVEAVVKKAAARR